MKIVTKIPPMADDIYGKGMKPDWNKVILTYGDTIYNPSGRELPDYLVKHEEVHSKQQGDDPEAWWNRYLQDPYFRISQETIAYAKQFDVMCAKVKDKNKRNLVLIELAKILSSATYGNVIGQVGAMKAIRNMSNLK